MPKNAFFLCTRDLLISPKTMQRLFLFTLHPLSTVIFATATVLAFVLLCNSNFNFHCYTQHEAMPTQKSARKCAATCHDFFHERLQSAFTLANQLHWIAQYPPTPPHPITHTHTHSTSQLPLSLPVPPPPQHTHTTPFPHSNHLQPLIKKFLRVKI